LSTDPTSGAGGQAPRGPAAGEPSEAELRAAYEAELSRVTSTDMIAQAAVSLLNLGARRLGPPPADPSGAAPAPDAQAAGGGRDLEQARDAIDAARALLGVLERTIPQELGPLRDALSQLQMAYAREIQIDPSAVAPPDAGAGAPPASGAAPGERQAPAGAAVEPESKPAPDAPGPAEASGRLWVPGR
jgi:hypothetical protein